MTQGTQIITVDPENRFEVAQADKPTAFIPAGFHSVLKFAELVATSGMAPQFRSPDQIAVAIFHGLEVGLTPMAALQSIAIVNGRASIWGDGALAMVRASGQLEDIEEFYEGTFPNDDFTAVCIVTRKGAKRPVRQEFSIADAKLAGLWTKDKTPWQTYPKRMLKMRARSWALRDEFTDVMRGLIVAEEAQDFEDMRDVTPSREEPPEQPVDTAKTKRGRPAKTTNQYQDDDKAGAKGGGIIEGDVVKDKTADETENEEPPADKKAVTKPAEKDKEPVKEKETKPVTEKETEADAGDVFLDELLSRVGPNRPLKEHLKYLHKLLKPLDTEEAMRNAWRDREKFAGGTKAEEEYIKELRDSHKERIANGGASNEEPPAEDKKQTQQFDYSGFLHMLDVKLGEQKEPDDVNKVYDEITTEPVKAGLITPDQVDADLRPLLIQHLERADLG